MKYGMAIIVALLMMIVSSQAADRWWDGTNSGGVGDEVSDGGTGTWDTVTLNWDQEVGVDRVAWNNSNNDTAIFGGTPGTVTLGTGITVGGLQFDTASYTIVGSGNVLTWGAAGSIVANQDVSIGPIMAGSVPITKSGAGSVTLLSKSTYTGGTTVNDGTLILGAGGNIGTLRGALTVNSGATVTSTVANSMGILTPVNPLNINGGNVDLSAGQHQFLGVTVNMVGGTLKFSSSTQNEHSNTVYNVSNSTSQAQILVQPGGAMRMISSAIAPCITFNVEDGSQDVDLLVEAPITIFSGAGGLTKNGAGTAKFTGTNTYTGGTIVNAGTLVLGAGGNVGTLRGALTVNSGATVTSTVANALGIGTSVSPLNINEGTVDLSFGQHHIWGSTVNMVGGTLKFSSNIDNEQFNVVYNISNSTSQAQILSPGGGAMRMRDSTNAPCITFNVEDGAQDVDLLVDVRITVGTGVGGLTKNGAGVMKLTKANTYPGPTVISGGTLIMNGSHSGGGLSYTVTVGGALSGTGTISSAVTVDGVIAPGDSGIGKLTVGSVSWAAGPAWPFELGTDSSSDQLAINGGFTNNGGTGFAFDLQNTGVAGVYTLVTWTASTTFTNTDFSANNVPVGLTSAFTMDANNLMLELTAGSGDITAEATNTTTAVVGGQFTFGFNIASGALYRVQASTNLVDPVDNGFTNITTQLTNQQTGTIIYTNTTSDLLRMFRVTSP